MSAATEQRQFTAVMRLFHWLTAALVLTMLGIGLAMVASLADYHRLVSIHRPLGILILIVVVIRFVNRHYSALPPFPATMSPRERSVASASELFLYALLVVQPLIGWGMLSAARYPITLLHERQQGKVEHEHRAPQQQAAPVSDRIMVAHQAADASEEDHAEQANRQPVGRVTQEQ